MPSVWNHYRAPLSFDGAPLPDRVDVEVSGKTLGEALADYANLSGVKLTPYDSSQDERSEPGKYFLYEEEGSRFDQSVVDVHIMRGDEEICPRQDLSFPLLPNDTVHVLAMVC